MLTICTVDYTNILVKLSQKWDNRKRYKLQDFSGVSSSEQFLALLMLLALRLLSLIFVSNSFKSQIASLWFQRWLPFFCSGVYLAFSAANASQRQNAPCSAWNVLVTFNMLFVLKIAEFSSWCCDQYHRSRLKIAPSYICGATRRVSAPSASQAEEMPYAKVASCGYGSLLQTRIIHLPSWISECNDIRKSELNFLDLCDTYDACLITCDS